MSNNNTIYAIVLGIVTLVVVAIAGLVFFSNNSNNNSNNNTDLTTNNSETDRATEANSTNKDTTVTNSNSDPAVSELNPDPDTDSSFGELISIEGLDLSLEIPAEISQVESLNVYKKLANYDNCDYMGEGSNEELVILISEIGSSCFREGDFDSVGADTLAGYNIEQLSSQRNKTDLLARRVQLDNNVEIVFMFKQEYAVRQEQNIDSILSTVTLE